VLTVAGDGSEEAEIRVTHANIHTTKNTEVLDVKNRFGELETTLIILICKSPDWTVERWEA
jgi:hypothetical protein